MDTGIASRWRKTPVDSNYGAFVFHFRVIG